MNLSELCKWAVETKALDNAQLLSSGVREKRLSKVKPHLQSIIDKASMVIFNTEKNNILMNNIDNDLKVLLEAGLPTIVKEIKQEKVLGVKS